MGARWPSLGCMLVLVAACGGSSTTDMGVDAPVADAGHDAGAPDAGDAGSPDATTCPDEDSDGHHAMSCGGDDCDDTDADRYPGNVEVCDALGHDEDCDTTSLGPDADSDTFVGAGCCNTRGDGTLHCGDDCDDTRMDVNPSAPEICNGQDDDCDGLLDGPAEDDDHDGHPNDACAGTAGTDCDDSDATIYDGAPELCDGQQNDCGGPLSREDLDGDGHFATDALCAGGPRGADPHDDCDDLDPSAYPGNAEVRDAAAHDEDCDPATVGLDEDGDGSPFVACCNGTTCGTDCDDTRVDVHVGGVEVCNYADDDCSGVIDDGLAGCTDPYAGSLPCGAATCSVPTEMCCAAVFAHPAVYGCQPLADDCPVSTPTLVQCDGPEDCTGGQLCETSTVVLGAPVRCVAPLLSPSAIYCHYDSQCPAGQTCTPAGGPGSTCS